jgi:hypothetical protein
MDVAAEALLDDQIVFVQLGQQVIDIRKPLVGHRISADTPCAKPSPAIRGALKREPDCITTS